MATAKRHSDYTKEFTEVCLAELDYIKQRRERMGLSSDEVIQETQRIRQELNKPRVNMERSSPKRFATPSANAGLVGLALSGGGIRSATFNLGLLQGLADKKVLQYCDYLSTVSGGGYIGSCVSSLLTDTPESSTKPNEFPLRDQSERTRERKEVTHLRASKNYLGLNRSLFNIDNWHAVGLDISAKVVLNTIPLSFTILLALLLYIGESTFYKDFLDLLDSDFTSGIFKFIEFIPVVSLSTLIWIAAILAIIVVLVTRWRQVSAWWKHSYESRKRDGSRISHWTVLAVSLVALSLLLDFIYSQAWRWVVGDVEGSFQIMDMFFYLSMAAFAVMLVGQVSPSKSPAQQKLSQLLISSALAILFITLPIGFLALVYEVEFRFQMQFLSDKTCKQLHTPEAVKVVEKCIDEVVKPELEKLYVETDGYLRDVVTILEDPQVEMKFDEVTRNKLLGVIVDYRQHQTVRRTLSLALLALAVVLLLMGVFIDINKNSLHFFYRDRLSGTFLVRRLNGEMQPNHALLLKDLHRYYNGPYHLVNVTLNVPVSKNPLLHGRGADLFMFSKYYCGAEVTGYRRTASYQEGRTKLSTAMAISGAAASPQMGSGTNPFFAAAMTLLNVRLHQWLPNPKLDKMPHIFWPSYLLKELLRRGTENDTLLNMSDGGHHENLGVLPLLKRHCRLIIASDAGADPDFSMSDLANVERKARIDLGTEIIWGKKSGGDLGLDKQHQTKRRFLVGRIEYPDDTDGILLYLKATITGTEMYQDVLAYRRKNPTFPHQTTANQFFDEDQFESYRKLGQLSAQEVFPNEINSLAELEEWLEKLLNNS